MAAAPIGTMLAQWRRTRRVSQLDLALEAGVSAWHVSFVETGRARPSRDIVVRLCEALTVPLRERNAMLLAAGFAPVYRETPLESPELAEVVAALALLLRRNEPYGGVAFDRQWDVVMANAPYIGMLQSVLGEAAAGMQPLAIVPPPRPNLLRLLFRTPAVRERLANWPDVSAALLVRARREAAASRDPALGALIEEVTAGLDAPLPAGPVAGLVVPVEMRTPDGTVRFLTTIATLGTAQDITLQELRIETYHPV